MARKSNKTAHVLNLLATGHDSKNENTDEAEVLETSEASEDIKVSETSAPQSVSVIDTTEADPVANLIHQKLLEELPVDIEPEPAHIPEPEPVPEPEPEPELAYVPQTESVSASEPESEPEAVVVSEPESEPVPVPAAAPEPEPVPEPEPEPDFVMVNVIEKIVRDKVIYFMRQFEVCTCDRCIEDTIALTLNGIAPKYIVTAPAAVDPLVSFYMNKYISTITVEITKACMTIKENPRH